MPVGKALALITVISEAIIRALAHFDPWSSIYVQTGISIGDGVMPMWLGLVVILFARKISTQSA